MRPCIVGLAVLVAPLPGAPAAPGPKDGPAEPLYLHTAVGTKWVYQGPGGEYEDAVREAKADGKATIVTVVRAGAGRGDWRYTLRVSPGGLDQLATDGLAHDPPLPRLRARAVAGDEWEYSYNLGGLAFHVRTTCRGPEAVEVPAGRFQALRLDIVETRAGSENVTRGTLWVAPGVGEVRRELDGRVTTLKRFVPGR